jgi:hypothetical protein
MMGRKQKVGALEYDVIAKAPLCLFNKPGVKKKIKKILNRKERFRLKKKLFNITQLTDGN